MSESAWWPTGGGEMGSRIRAFDWTSTALGPPDSWSPALSNVVTLMLDASHAAMVAWGPDLTTIYNDEFIPILGTRHPCLGQPLRSVFAEIWEEYQPLVEATLRGQSQYFVDRPVAIATGAQATRWFTFSWTPLRNPGREIMGFYCATQETTEYILKSQNERRKTRKALAASESRYRSLFNSIDEGFCIVELKFDSQGRALDYRFLEINRAFEVQTGLHDAAGKWMRSLLPAHEQHWYDIYGEVAQSGRSVRFVSHAEALGRWFSVNAFPVGDQRPSPVAVLFQDISERRRAELALREADRHKDEFIATLAHELRNPLAPVRSGLEIVQLKTGVASPLKPTLDMMDRQLNHLVRLVEDLMDIGRINSGKLQLRHENIDLPTVLEHTVQALRATNALHRHQLTLAVSDEIPRVSGDFERLTQAFTNIISNAIKYTDAGGQIRVSIAAEGPEAVVSISDTGIGIPEQDLPRVFELFWQVRSHHDRAGGGLGIGLALVKEIVSLHGGQVFAESGGAGQGSTFIVRLPAVSAQVEADSYSAPRDIDAPIKRRILVADDNEDAAHALAELLKMSGHEVFTAFDGQEAVDSAIRHHPEVVLLDIGMPVMGGIEAAREIRLRLGHPAPTLVALTGWGQDADKSASDEAGFDYHLVKPVTLDMLNEVLNAAPVALGSNP
jgi:PAS domain S-box-containing protein